MHYKLAIEIFFAVYVFLFTLKEIFFENTHFLEQPIVKKGIKKLNEIKDVKGSKKFKVDSQTS